MLVDAINNRKPSGATQSTVLGPFYVTSAPERALGDNICLDDMSGWQGNAACGFWTRHRHQGQPHRRRHP